MGERGGVIEMAGQRVNDLICTDVVVKKDMLAILDALCKSLLSRQWCAFLYRLLDQEGILGERCSRKSGDRSSQRFDNRGSGHVLVLRWEYDSREPIMTARIEGDS